MQLRGGRLINTLTSMNTERLVYIRLAQGEGYVLREHWRMLPAVSRNYTHRIFCALQYWFEWIVVAHSGYPAEQVANASPPEADIFGNLSVQRNGRGIAC